MRKPNPNNYAERERREYEHDLSRASWDGMPEPCDVRSLEALQSRAQGDRIILQRDPLGRMYLP